MVTPEQIDAWRRLPAENQNIEFKEAKEQFDFSKLCKYCVAIANEGGGSILLGIADTPPRPVVGTNAFRDANKVSQQLLGKLGFHVAVEEIAHPSGRVVVFAVPPRPKGTAYHLDGMYLMRSGSTLVPMSEDRLRAIFSEAPPVWLEEPAGSRYSADEIVELLDTQTYFQLLQLPYPASRDGVVDRLKLERLVVEGQGGLVLSRLGALLLAKDLEQFPELHRKAPRVIVYTGNDKNTTRLSQLGRRGYAVGFQGLVRFIMEQLPQAEVFQDALRKEVTLVPEEMVRELVGNALIHQDFSISGARVDIGLYQNRIEFTNPGQPIVPVERFIDNYRSRNERLADLMRRMRICEERGSGIGRVVHAAERLPLPAPDFQVNDMRTIVTLFPPRPFDQMDRSDRVRACYQHCVLKWVGRERMTNQSLRQRFNLPDSKAVIVSQVILATVDAGLIRADESVGASRKFARYLPGWA